MARVILVGADAALLEGLAQTLVGSGHEVSFAPTVAEIPVEEESPGLAVVAADVLADLGPGASISLPQSCALIVYGTSHDDRPFLSAKLQRATLAHLVLPLERHRLLALVHSYDNRSRRSELATREELDEDTELRL
ncbi:MAG: hypothetical protein ABR585_05320 [Gemmatimonadaceae bacterium]